MIDTEGIAAFLMAQYDAAQRLAEAAADAACFGGGVNGTRWSNPGGGDLFCAGLPVAALGPWADSATKNDLGAFIAGNDPASVLADLVAKRAIIAAYVQAKADFDAAAPHASDVSAFDGGILTGHMVGLREAVMMLAAEFAEHPKSKPEWRIDA